MSIGRLEHKRFPDNLLKKVRFRRDLRAELQHLSLSETNTVDY